MDLAAYLVFPLVASLAELRVCKSCQSHACCRTACGSTLAFRSLRKLTEQARM